MTWSRSLTRAAIGVVVVMVVAPVYPATGSYGLGMTVAESETIAVAEVMADPEAFAERRIRVSGKVDQVCARRGCWLSLAAAEAGAGESLFVKFTCPIEGRLIPVEAVDRVAVVEGELTIKMISEEMARHIAEEAGESEGDVAKIVGEQRQISLASSAALVHDLPASGGRSSD